jgi:hypothetical protein
MLITSTVASFILLGYGLVVIGNTQIAERDSYEHLFQWSLLVGGLSGLAGAFGGIRARQKAALDPKPDLVSHAAGAVGRVSPILAALGYSAYVFLEGSASVIFLGVLPSCLLAYMLAVGTYEWRHGQGERRKS